MYSRTTSIYGVSEFRIKNNQLLISKHRFKKQKEKQKGKSEDVPMKNKLQNYFLMIRTQGEYRVNFVKIRSYGKHFVNGKGNINRNI